MSLVIGILILVALAALVGFLSSAAARSRPTGVVAGVAALLGGAYFSLVKIAQAIGEYEENRAGYDEWVSETDFFVGLAVHMLAPAVVLVLARVAWRAVGSADRAADERGDDGEGA